ncbi:MAG: Ig-like domain-containing protein [Gammaproteobacteria bacterium]|nr:Ig-like domain-containing protein [Gammaproteobacteria bacterium]
MFKDVKLIKLIVLSLLMALLFSAPIDAQTDKSQLQPQPFEQSLSNNTDQVLSFNSTNFGLTGPFVLSGEYSKNFGYMLKGSWAQLFLPETAANLVFEYGSKQKRINGTIGQGFFSSNRIKFTAERLWQDIDFDFTSGNVTKMLAQNAFGLTYEFLISEGFFRDINLNASYSKADSKALDAISYFNGDGLFTTNYRNIVGGKDKSINAGIDLHPHRSNNIGLQLNYDALTYLPLYDTTLKNVYGFGVSISLKQLITDRIKLQLSMSNRKIYKDYQTELDFLFPSKKGSLLEFGITGERVTGVTDQPNDNRVLVHARYSIDANLNNEQPKFNLDSNSSDTSLLSWTTNPAVYMQAVLVAKDQANVTYYKPTIMLHEVQAIIGKAIDLSIKQYIKAGYGTIKSVYSSIINLYGLHFFLSSDGKDVRIVGIPKIPPTAILNQHRQINDELRYPVDISVVNSAGQSSSSTFYLNLTSKKPATLVSIAVTPASKSITKGTTQKYIATGTYSDGTKQVITPDAWSSAKTTVATIDSKGLATAVGLGITTISATKDKISGSTDLTVTAATLVSIAVTPTAKSIAKGTTQQYTATGTYTDGTKQVITPDAWSSAKTTVATIDSKGLATAVGLGITTISATKDKISGSTDLTVTAATLVSIAVTPTVQSIAKGTTQQYKATGIYTDGTTSDITTVVNWHSSDSVNAPINNVGLATGNGETPIGMDAVMKATLGTTSGSAAPHGTISGSATLTVTAPVLVSIAVTPASQSIAKGLTQQYTATGTYSDGTKQVITPDAWNSAKTTVATIDSKGIATGVGLGTTTISATKDKISGSTDLTVTAATLVSIAVTPDVQSIAKGTTQQYKATGTYTDHSTSDITTQVKWNSSDSANAPINSTGLATGNGKTPIGMDAKITATQGTISGTAMLTVTDPVLVSIAVTPDVQSIAKGTTQQYKATGTYTDHSTSDITTQVKWNSSDSANAPINSTGLATGNGKTPIGMDAKITATQGTISGTAMLTVTDPALVSIAVTSASQQIFKDETLQYTATGTYTDGSTKNITYDNSTNWSSSATNIATINNNIGDPNKGLASGKGVGTATITATSGAISNYTSLKVVAVTLLCPSAQATSQVCSGTKNCSVTVQDSALRNSYTFSSNSSKNQNTNYQHLRATYNSSSNSLSCSYYVTIPTPSLTLTLKSAPVPVDQNNPFENHTGSSCIFSSGTSDNDCKYMIN